tara:strand:+ start:693 stop:836 length:144 start_codon:yes stop_codon:yes gene_type:complete
MNEETRFTNAGKIGDAIGLTRYILNNNPDNTKDKLKELIQILDSIEL